MIIIVIIIILLNKRLDLHLFFFISRRLSFGLFMISAGADKPSSRLAHQALLVTMRPSSALHDRRLRLVASVDAVTRTNGGKVITLLHATCTQNTYVETRLDGATTRNNTNRPTVCCVYRFRNTATHHHHNSNNDYNHYNK